MTLNNAVDFATDNPELAAIFESFRGKRVKYYPNPGNAGDSLIAAATYQLFSRYGVDVEIIDGKRRLEGETIFLGGGGNLVPMYNSMASMIEAQAKRKNRIVVLPHSIGGHDDVFSLLSPDDVICCRELPSYSYMLKLDTRCKAILTHDLALYLDIERLNDGIADLDSLRGEFVQILEKDARLSLDQLVGKPISCIRRGVERTFLPKGPNYDISTVFRTGVTRGNAERGAWMLLEFCRLASHIATNRLHVGIACALVGTPVVLYDNSYGKVSSVHRHSMAGRFPNIETRFEEEPRPVKS